MWFPRPNVGNYSADFDSWSSCFTVCQTASSSSSDISAIVRPLAPTRRSIEVNRLVNLSLLSDEAHVSCEGRIVWAWLEPHSKGKKLRYRAGIFFTKVDEAAIEDFIGRHAAK